MTTLPRNKPSERGTSAVEALTAVLIMALLFFGLLQIRQWCLTGLFCDYASYYAAKAVALGYTPQAALRAARVAAMPVCGRRYGGENLSPAAAAEQYMRFGDLSGIRCEYWNGNGGGAPELRLRGEFGGDGMAYTSVTMENAPLIHPRLSVPLGIKRPPEPGGRAAVFNYSGELLK